ncbi:MAG: hypothetical protein CM15mP21_7460 [Hyphomicrobiales bacterium]|nr:MAG: hypothetical protein CM15mP21_7460 [Hyphomicrobiales bacterium]
MPDVKGLSLFFGVFGPARKAANPAPVIRFSPKPPPIWGKRRRGRPSIPIIFLAGKQAIKSAFPGDRLLCDVALAPYTTHGHEERWGR